MNYAYSKLNIKELFTLVERIIHLSKKEKFQNQTATHPLFLELEKQFTRYQKSYAQTTFSGKGELLFETDQKRDLLFKALKQQIYAISQVKELANAQVASELLIILKKVGRLDKLSYAEESTQLNICLQELSVKANADKLRKLHLFELYELLKNTQTEFERLYAKQTEAKAKQQAQLSATALKKDLIGALKNYVSLLDIMQKQTEWADLFAEVNESIKSVQITRHYEKSDEPHKKEAEETAQPALDSRANEAVTLN